MKTGHDWKVLGVAGDWGSMVELAPVVVQSPNGKLFGAVHPGVDGLRWLCPKKSTPRGLIMMQTWRRYVPLDCPVEADPTSYALGVAMPVVRMLEGVRRPCWDGVDTVVRTAVRSVLPSNGPREWCVGLGALDDLAEVCRGWKRWLLEHTAWLYTAEILPNAEGGPAWARARLEALTVLCRELARVEHLARHGLGTQRWDPNGAVVVPDAGLIRRVAGTGSASAVHCNTKHLADGLPLTVAAVEPGAGRVVRRSPPPVVRRPPAPKVRRAPDPIVRRSPPPVERRPS